ncbi:LPD7 domain-containing protein [Bombella saccharophila]|uniref:Large polyvalent protein-associated domain-containing protein n=1 Tax=Bombella saccharophila TaxID=2967338 RepID=A0ABT3W8H4_9PROT|nr:LPD7 domain-containing protein [Bombella saccharophila]MCX5614102.1 hypothetical protein [Bombella saccharophila]
MSSAGSGIHYVKANRETAFTDRGQQILARKHTTDEDVLAMLRLAEERYPRGFTLQGSEQWKARATRIARENRISFEGWYQGKRPSPGARDRDRALQQTEREGKPGYMDLTFWKILPETWREQERELHRTPMHAGWQRNSSGLGFGMRLTGVAVGSPTIRMTRQRRRLSGKRGGAWR